MMMTTYGYGFLQRARRAEANGETDKVSMMYQVYSFFNH